MRLRIVCICIAAAGSAAAAEPVPESQNFVASAQCIACHSNLHTAAGEDVSIGYDWRSSMMANSARDPYWHAAVRREVTDHPVAQRAIEDKCATCHMPMARFESAARGESGEVFGNLDLVPANPLADDGVSCTVCHQIAATNFGEHASFDGGFAIATGAAPGERQLLRSARGRSRPSGRHAFGDELRADGNDASAAVGALRDVPYAFHERSRRRRRSDRRAARASPVSGMAAQRISRNTQLPELPHARGHWRGADRLRARPAAAASFAAHVPRRECFHVEHSEQISIRSRCCRDAAGARCRRPRDESVSAVRSGQRDDRVGQSDGQRARRSTWPSRARRVTSCRRRTRRGAPGCTCG